jgi:hypothetical protein
MSSESYESNICNRQNLERTITKIGIKSDASRLLDNIVLGDGYDKYRQLGRAMNNAWQVSLENSCPEKLYPKNPDKALACQASLSLLGRKKSGVAHGFDVSAMLIGMSVASYIRLRPTGQRSLEELVAMQKNPETIKRLPLMLASKPNEINRQFEEALGLFDGAYDGVMQFDQPSVIAHKKDNEVGVMLPNMIQILQSVNREALNYEGNPQDSCPAQRFIPLLWANMVDYCASDSRFFINDLEKN